MLFATPTLPPATERRLAELDALHAQIDQVVAALEPVQRAAFHATARAATIAASAAIEGFHVTPEDLHVVSVHPFRDGNGRVSRVVQALVLASGGRLAPELGSIEECFWERRSTYYNQLQHVHGSAYDPTRHAGDWVTFCIDGHLAQARRRLAQADSLAEE